MTNGRIVGAPAVRGEGEAKVSGRARYTADMEVPNMLWCKALRSPIAHGRIKRMDTGKALAAPGVRAVVTGADLPGARIGKKIIDMPLLADGVVRYIGEKVAAVAADSEAAAATAAALIEVEYEEIEAVVDPVEAARPSAPLIHPDVTTYPGLLHRMDAPSNVFVRLEWRKGDVDAAFREADLVVENTFTTPLIHHGYIEPHCCIVEARGEGADVWASSKSPFSLRDHLAGALGIPAHKIVAHPGAIGGDFGGKGDANDIALCYVLSKRTGRPVKYLMEYNEELTSGNPRHASVTTVKTGVKNNGLIVAQHMRLLFDSGAYGSFRPQGYLVGAHTSGGPYKIAHFLLEESYVYTNKVPCGYMRAPGHPQGFFANESQLDMVARRLGMDPAELRRINFLHDGDLDPTGTPVGHIQPDQTLDSAIKTSDYHAPKQKNVGRGIALAQWMSKGGESYIGLRVEADGTAALAAALGDVGPGAHTMMQQVVAQELDMPLEDVRVESVDTTRVARDTGVRGSSSTRVHGSAAWDAANKARAELLGIAADRMGVPAGELSIVNRGITHLRSERRMTFAELVEAAGEPVTVTGHYRNPTDGPETSMVAQVAEVEVDPETGRFEVRRLTTAHNTGTVLNPLGHQGQIDGAVVMGLGFARCEDIVTDSGRVVTANLGDYKLPNIKDIPPLRTQVTEAPVGSGPYGSMSIGETAVIPTAAAVANAVHDAVGVRVTSLPVTAERVFQALQAKGEQEPAPGIERTRRKGPAPPKP